jgi:hypothetical protein
MFASGAAYNKAFRACIDRNDPIRTGLGPERKSAFPQRLARHSEVAGRSVFDKPTCRPCRRVAYHMIVKSTHLPLSLPNAGGFVEINSMPDPIQADRARLAPSIVPAELPNLSDDECLARLARAIAAHDSEHLDEVALLIGRLAVTIE